MKKGLIILALVLIVIGAAVFAIAFVAAGNDITKLGTAKAETNTHVVEESFTKIDVDTNECDVELKVSESGKTEVVCVELEREIHQVTVEEGTLKIAVQNNRNWIDNISFFGKSLSIKVYITPGAYESLKINSHTGDVLVPQDFSFTEAEITVSTGDVKYNAQNCDRLKIKSGTGDIKVEGVAVAGNTELSASTGKIEAKNLVCGGDLSVKVSTGKVVLTDVAVKNFTTDGSTGDVVLKNVIATEKFTIERSTGDIKFDNSDAAEIKVKTSTGDVKGTLRTEKTFIAHSTTGKEDVPRRTVGGDCKIDSSTGDIVITVVS